MYINAVYQPTVLIHKAQQKKQPTFTTLSKQPFLFLWDLFTVSSTCETTTTKSLFGGTRKLSCHFNKSCQNVKQKNLRHP